MKAWKRKRSSLWKLAAHIVRCKTEASLTLWNSDRRFRTWSTKVFCMMLMGFFIMYVRLFLFLITNNVELYGRKNSTHEVRVALMITKRTSCGNMAGAGDRICDGMQGTKHTGNALPRILTLALFCARCSCTNSSKWLRRNWDFRKASNSYGLISVLYKMSRA